MITPLAGQSKIVSHRNYILHLITLKRASKHRTVTYIPIAQLVVLHVKHTRTGTSWTTTYSRHSPEAIAFSFPQPMFEQSISSGNHQ